MRQLVLSAAVLVIASAAAQMPSGLKLQRRYPIAGAEGWDYITMDPEARRLYVSHAVRVNVINAGTGAPVGTIEDTPGVHGIAIAPSSKHGFTSNSKEDRVSMFNTADLSLIKKIEVGKGPHGIYYDANTDRIFTNNHHSHDITAIDATKGEVVGTVAVGGDGEGAGVGKDGLIYGFADARATTDLHEFFTLTTARAYHLVRRRRMQRSSSRFQLPSRHSRPTRIRAGHWSS